MQRGPLKIRERLTWVGPARKRVEVERAALVRNCRSIYIAAAMLILAFGAVYKLAEPGAEDPWIARLSLAAIFGGMSIATRYVEWLRLRCVEVTAGLLCALTAWLVFVTALNDFSAAYGVGLVFTIAAVGFVILLTQDGVRPVLWYATASTLMVASFLLAFRPPEANAWLTIGAVAGIGIVIVLSSRLRTLLVASLAASEKRFRKLSEAAFEAIFIMDGGRIVDCNTNALELLGHASDERLWGCTLADFMPESERGTATHAGETDIPYRYESSILHSDGTVVPVEIRGRSATDEVDDIRVLAVRDISEQKKYEEELIESRARVQETLDVRNTILTNVSHEFRTPLAIILGYSEMLKEGKFDDARELGDLIHESSRTLNDTLNLILELAQIDGGGFTLENEPADVAMLAKDAIRAHNQRARLKSLQMNFDAAESDHFANVDRVRLLKIVDYLLDNAIKFTDEGGINVTIESDPEWTHISVADTGIGIEEAFLPNLFTPFKQESSGLTRSHGGLGVGLAIARRMAESMGGRITASSNKGKGSTFVVSMPRTCTATPSERVDRAFSPGIA